MSDTKETKVPQAPTPTPAAEQGEHGEHAENKREDNTFHPHKRHDHAVIKPPHTGVTHLDPGAITFS